MTERRRGLGRGLGALIPTGPADDSSRPSDVFFREREPHPPLLVSRETVAPALRVATMPENPRDSGELREVPGARYVEVPVDLIGPNPRQPRAVFDPDELAELVASIREIGVLQPVVVRPLAVGASVGLGVTERSDEGTADDSASDGSSPAPPDWTVPTDRTRENGVPVRYELVMGERRWRAVRDAGLDTIPAIVKETSDDAMLRDALLENLHRSQLNVLEEAAAYQQLLDDFGCTHDELATRIGKSRPQISNTLRLLRLPGLVARRVAAGVLSAGHARALLGLEDAAAMERLAQRIVAEGLSVRSVEEIVALGGGPATKDRRLREPVPRDGRLDEVASRLSDRFDTRVSVAMGQRKGKLTVEFASLADLERIVALLDT